VVLLICKERFNLLNLSKVFLALLIFSINVNGGNFLNTKELFFFLLVLTGCIFGDYGRIKPLLLMLFLYFSSFFVNLILPGSNLNSDQGLYFSLGFFYLFLLVFNKNDFRKVTIDTYLFSAKVVAVFIIAVWFVCFLWNDIKWQLIMFFDSVENDNVAFIFMIRTRKILDWWFPGVYYSTAPCLIPALAYYLAKAIRNNYNIHKTSCLILFLGLIFTAARANILAAFVLFIMYLVITNLSKRRIVFAISIAMVALVGVIFVMYLFLTDIEESSLAVKTLHKQSYLYEFGKDQFRTIIFGWGAGSSFFTQGFNEYTMLTELTLYETVRRYGFISMLVILLFIWFPPIFRTFQGGFQLSTVYLGGGLFIYILVASTNPFLLGSIGFCALFFFSSAIDMSLNKNLKYFGCHKEN